MSNKSLLNYPHNTISKKAPRELKSEFIGRGEVKGMLFRQIRVTNWGFLYEVTDCGTKRYEVFKRRINHRFATYSYPSSRSFGIWAWNYKDIRHAFNKLFSFENEV